MEGTYDDITSNIVYGLGDDDGTEGLRKAIEVC